MVRLKIWIEEVFETEASGWKYEHQSEASGKIDLTQIAVLEISTICTKFLWECPN